MWMCVCVRARVCRWVGWWCQSEALERCWHPTLKKSEEICRAERISDSRWAKKRWVQRKRGGEDNAPWWCTKWPLRGRERTTGAAENGCVCVWGGSSGRSTGRDPKPGHLLQREQLWKLCPWEEGHSRKLCILHTKAQILPLCLHPAQVCNNKAN